ncbi:MAG: oligosaccharide flippase family protein, partial [Acidobacteriota bacterium]
MLEKLQNLPFIRKLDHHMHEVLRGASIAFVMKSLGGVLDFGVNVALARMLGAEGAGVFFLALSITTIATVFGRMGLDNTFLRFTAASAAVGDWKSLKGMYRKGLMVAATASLTTSVTMFAFSPWVAENIFGKPELAQPVRWMSLAVLPLALQILHAELLKGLKRILASTFLQEHGVGLSSLTLLGIFLLSRTWGVYGAIGAVVIAATAMAATGAFLWWKWTPELRETSGHFDTKELLQSSLPLFWVASMNLVMNWTGSFSLGIWGTNADVGVFNLAARTALLTSVILVAINSIVAPKFAGLYRLGDMEALGKVARNSTKLMTFFAAPILLVFLIFPKLIMYIFGPSMVEHWPILVVLALGQFVCASSGSAGYLLMM